MKTVINAILALCAIALVYICYGSIMGPINFDKEKLSAIKLLSHD